MSNQMATTELVPSDLIKQVQSKIGSVKMLPDVAVRALEIAKDPDASVAEFSEVIQQDIKLAADVLAMANSVLYSSGRPTASLTQAVTRLGFQQCKNVILTSSLASVMKNITTDEAWIREVLWKHSVITGVIATQLNKTLGIGFEGEEFTAGLVHDFGRTLLAVTYPDTFSTFDSMEFDECENTLRAENQIIGSNHCDLGAWFAREQGLPDALREVIQYHHTPTRAEEHSLLVALTATADHMANHIQRVGETEPYEPVQNPGPSFLEQAGIANAVSRFEQIAVETMLASVEPAREMIDI